MKYKATPLKRSYKRKTFATWINIATDINAGLSVKDIQERYLNPKTGKPYSRKHIWHICNEIATKPLKELIKF